MNHYHDEHKSESMAWIALILIGIIVVAATLFFATDRAGDSVDIDIVTPSSAATSSVSASGSSASGSGSSASSL